MNLGQEWTQVKILFQFLWMILTCLKMESISTCSIKFTMMPFKWQWNSFCVKIFYFMHQNHIPRGKDFDLCVYHSSKTWYTSNFPIFRDGNFIFGMYILNKILKFRFVCSFLQYYTVLYNTTSLKNAFSNSPVAITWWSCFAVRQFSTTDYCFQGHEFHKHILFFLAPYDGQSQWQFVTHKGSLA